MIRPCSNADFQAVEAVINEGAEAYRGAIPADCWHEPYMTTSALKAEIEAGSASQHILEHSFTPERNVSSPDVNALVNSGRDGSCKDSCSESRSLQH